jgi:fatty-acid desaturase
MILAIHRETHREIEAGTDTHEENALGILNSKIQNNSP